MIAKNDSCLELSSVKFLARCMYQENVKKI